MDLNILSKIPSSPPIIKGLPVDEQIFLWSVMIPVYNCSQYIPEVLKSVLDQDPGSELMQIEVVDDASTNADVEELVRSLGNGRVQYYRQPENVGSLRNFETCINRSRGKLIHLLHGDDRVKPGFYKKMGSLFEQFPEAGAAFSNYSFINEAGEISKNFILGEKEDGILNKWLIRIAEFQKIQYASMVIRREVYENIGAYFGMSYGEDWEMWVRVAKHYPVAHTPEVLAEYRGRLGSITWEKSLSGELGADILSTIHYIQTYMPKNRRAQVMKKSKSHCAHILIAMAINLWISTKDFSKSQRLIRQALALRKSTYIFMRVIKFYFHVAIFKITGKSMLDY